jgi:hypothetical protein
MPEQTFYCPSCRRRVTKSAHAYVMGESMTTKGAVFVNLGNLPETIPCPGCGAAIDNKRMMLGEYDRPPPGGAAGGSKGVIIVAILILLAVAFFWFR